MYFLCAPRYACYRMYAFFCAPGYLYAGPAVPGSVFRMLPAPPGFLYFGWLSGTTLKSDFSLLIFVDSALRRPRALSGHFPTLPVRGERGQGYQVTHHTRLKSTVQLLSDIDKSAHICGERILAENP